VGARAAEQLFALEERALRRIEVAQEERRVGRRERLCPTDLAADAVAHVAQELARVTIVGAAQQILEHLQFAFAVGRELMIGKDETRARLRQIAEPALAA